MFSMIIHDRGRGAPYYSRVPQTPAKQQYARSYREVITGNLRLHGRRRGGDSGGGESGGGGGGGLRLQHVGNLGMMLLVVAEHHLLTPPAGLRIVTLSCFHLLMTHS